MLQETKTVLPTGATPEVDEVMSFMQALDEKG